MKESRSCLFPLIASFYLILLLRQNGVVSAFTLFRSAPCNGIEKEMRTSSWLKSSSDIPSYDAEVVDDGEQDDNFDWTPDSEKVRLAQESRFKAAEATPFIKTTGVALPKSTLLHLAVVTGSDEELAPEKVSDFSVPGESPP